MSIEHRKMTQPFYDSQNQNHEYKEEILINEQYLKALLKSIHQAKSSIDMEVYIFEDDIVGQLVSEALCQAAKNGVQIRILIDGIGSVNWGGKIKKNMEFNNIKIKIFHPLPWKISHWVKTISDKKSTFSKIIYLLSRINYRNHRKVCIIDKHIVFVGSANINYNLLNHDIYKGWRETTIKLTGVNVDEIQYAFNKAWGDYSFKDDFRHSFQKTYLHSVFLLNYSLRLRYKYYKFLLNKISECQKRIWVTNAYFVPDSHLLKKLKEASQRGVDVRILLPEKSDVPIVSMVSETFYSTLLKNNVLIYHYTPTILHAKILIIDDWYIVGSSNLNYRSFKQDLEVNVNIQKSTTKKIIQNQFLVDLEHSHQLRLSDLKSPSFFKKIIVYFILLIRHWI